MSRRTDLSQSSETRSIQDPVAARLTPPTVGVLGPVRGFGEGQGAFGQRAGGGEITELPQNPGEVVQAGADGGVLGPICGFGEGQGAFPK